MRLLVTRPEPDASETAAKLRALGHEVLVEPLLTIAFNPPPAEIAKPAALIFSSMNGVRALATWPVAREWSGVPVFALAGVADAITLLAPGIAAGITQGHGRVHTGADLAAAVRAALPAGSGPVFYPAARDRSGELETVLTAAGYELRIVEAYCADPVHEFSSTTRDTLARGQIDGVLLYSRRTAQTYLRVGDRARITAELRVPSYYVISQPVADLLSDLAAAVHVAKFPNEDSLLALIPAPR